MATPLAAGGSPDGDIPIKLTGTDIDSPIASVTVKTLPDASQGLLTLADGTPVIAGVALTPSQAAGLKFKPNQSFNGTASFTFTVTDDKGMESAPAFANVKVSPDGGLFEQLQSQPIKPYRGEFNPNNIEIRTPVIPIGMPEDLFVSFSVHESANQISANSPLGVFNADTPSLNEIKDFTFDLKGLPIGMDSHLYVQHAVRSQPVTTETNLFVQNAVRQSQVESSSRNIGVTSFNSASNAVTSLLGQFQLGSPNDVADLSIDGVQGDFAKTTKQETNRMELPQQANALDSGLNKDVSTQTLVNIALEKMVIEKAMAEKTKADKYALDKAKIHYPKNIAAPSFANQLKVAANKFKHNGFKEKI